MWYRIAREMKGQRNRGGQELPRFYDNDAGESRESSILNNNIIMYAFVDNGTISKTKDLIFCV